MKQLTTLIYIFALTLLFSGCHDDYLYDRNYGEGVTKVSFTLVSEPFTGTSLGTRGTEGEAIKQIKNLTIVAYKPLGEAGYELFDIWHLGAGVDFTTVENYEMPSDYNQDPNGIPAEEFHQAEMKTYKTTFDLKDVPYGDYYFYAVANVDPALLTKETLDDDPQTLKEMAFEWKSDVKLNNQMFGFFTLDKDEEKQAGIFNEAGFLDGRRVSVGPTSNKLHCWLKRLASKVTLVFDPSGLHEGIHIYINKVTIKDIPTSCALGQINTPTNREQLILNGESISYDNNNNIVESREDNATDYSNWLHLTKAGGLKGAVEVVGQQEVDGNEGLGDLLGGGNEMSEQIITHSEKATALYFYENMQGNESQNPNKEWFNKKPGEGNKVGSNVDEGDIEHDWKDRKPFGTYIEVEGYYVSENKNNQSQGPIKYRFMLGKDTKYDYNAERNMHYKLTLKFRGYANQPDWHIEYKEKEPDAYLPEVFYVPYLYNKRAMLPIRLTGNCISIKAQIIENNWAPYDEATKTVPAAVVGSEDLSEKKLAFRWNKEVYDNSGQYYGLKEASNFAVSQFQIYNGPEEEYNGTMMPEWQAVYGGQDRKVTAIWAGFLALTVPPDYENGEIRQLPTEIFNNRETSEYSWLRDNNKGNNAMRGLRQYFIGTYPSGNVTLDKYTKPNKLPQHQRTYDLENLNHQDNRKGTLNEFTVSPNNDGSTTVEIPMWTRPKDMIYISGFSGNNPYINYMRRAIVRFTFIFDHEGKKVKRVKYLPVFQVRRVMNPKGVWRSSRNTTPFHVVLKHIEGPAKSTFTDIESRGEWWAEITAETTPGHITLRARGESEQEGKKVTGSTGSIINFQINFNSQGNNDCAVVTVYYHGGSAQHTIYVRHGYETPIRVVDGGAEWSSYAVYNFKDNPEFKTTSQVEAVETVNPLALGSMFKRANFSQGIRIWNNNKWGPLVSIAGEKLKLTNGEEEEWKNIEGLVYNGSLDKQVLNDGTYEDDWQWPEIKVGDDIYTVPTIDDYNELLNQDFGYGICYADPVAGTRVQETQNNIDDAFSFFNDDNGVTESHYGMRGVFAINLKDGRNIFFPVGAFGMGRRTTQNTNATTRGVLRYGAVGYLLSVGNGAHNAHRPIAYDNYHNPGCLYWVRGRGGNEGNRVAWDMNYTDMTFMSYDQACCMPQGNDSNGDAFPIKLIKKR